MNIEFKPLREVSATEMMDLMNDPRVRRHLPLAKGPFDKAAYDAFIKEKEQLWTTHGYGPWAIIIDGAFAGWGGLQYEQGDADLALILHPKYWGSGKRLSEEIIKRGFDEMGLKSITTLLPPSRTGNQGLLRLEFKPDGETTINGERFLRFRMIKPR